MLRFRRTGRLEAIPSVEEALAVPLDEADRAEIRSQRARIFVCSPGTVRDSLSRFAARVGASELMISTLIHDPADRLRSYELVASAFGLEGAREP